MTYTNEELNRMAAGVLGECWHEYEPYRAIHGNDNCLNGCGWTRYMGAYPGTNPDYCNDRNHAVRVAEAVDVEKLNTAIVNMWVAKATGKFNKNHAAFYAILPAKTLLLAAFVAHGIMPMDEAIEIVRGE